MEVRNALETSVQQEPGQALAFTRIIKRKFFFPDAGGWVDDELKIEFGRTSAF